MPEDRHKYGLVLPLPLSENITLQTYYQEPFSKKGILNFTEIQQYAKRLIEEYDVRTTSEQAPEQLLYLAGISKKRSSPGKLIVIQNY